MKDNDGSNLVADLIEAYGFGVAAINPEPAPDFAAMARSFGFDAFGPVEDPGDLRATLDEAVELIMPTRRPILVDVITQHR